MCLEPDVLDVVRGQGSSDCEFTKSEVTESGMVGHSIHGHSFVEIITTTHPKKDALNLTHYLLIGAAERSLEGFFKCFLKTKTTR